MRFQTAFTQMHEIVEFVNSAIDNGRRVVVEHFDLLFPALQVPADVMVGIGEEIIVVRPTVFGPSPQNVYDIVHTSLRFRKMAHTVEDITIQLLQEEFGIDHKYFYSSDIKYGFLLRFTERVDLDFEALAVRIREILNADMPVRYHDEDHILIGEHVLRCSGPRLHIRSTSDVKDFKLIKQFIRDEKTDTCWLFGMLDQQEDDFCKLNSFQYCHSDLILSPRDKAAGR